MSEAAHESYAGIDVELPDGSRRTCRVLTLGESLRFMGLVMRAQGGDAEATMTFLDEFAEAVGLRDARITPGEVFGLADSFFWSSRVEGDPTGPKTNRPTTPTESHTG